ncbi:hypothetical protein F2P81_019415 [Scophthalmus maximus]|uniref:Uncharacterized protein n=1 Tax=Scophthalmus maximus TaxID=52904 RepID=A0A6A4S7X4_SCOMX|nr:hypothetical protein F2P81_019415 [Scophthalmus maximus]
MTVINLDLYPDGAHESGVDLFNVERSHVPRVPSLAVSFQSNSNLDSRPESWTEAPNHLNLKGKAERTLDLIPQDAVNENQDRSESDELCDEPNTRSGLGPWARGHTYLRAHSADNYTVPSSPSQLFYYHHVETNPGNESDSSTSPVSHRPGPRKRPEERRRRKRPGERTCTCPPVTELTDAIALDHSNRRIVL